MAESPDIDVVALERAYRDAAFGSSSGPSMGWTTWEGYVHLCDKLGITVDPTLVVGMPVMMTSGHVETYYG